MRVILIAAISADAKIAQRIDQTSLDWTSKEDAKFFSEKTKEVGVLIMGRKTFETIGRPLKGRTTIVMTREGSALTGYENNTKEQGIVEYSTLGPREILDSLAGKGIEGVVIAGGSSVYSQFLRERLVSDVYLTIEPVLFGGGVPLAEGFERTNMQLVEVSKLGEQAVLLRFEVKKD